jgi:hypothetical protein
MLCHGLEIKSSVAVTEQRPELYGCATAYDTMNVAMVLSKE